MGPCPGIPLRNNRQIGREAGRSRTMRVEKVGTEKSRNGEREMARAHGKRETQSWSGGAVLLYDIAGAPGRSIVELPVS